MANRPLVGDRIWYWGHRRGEKAHIKRGVLIQHTGVFTRVRLDGNVFPSVQTVEYKRLHSEEEVPPSTGDAGASSDSPSKAQRVKGEAQ